MFDLLLSTLYSIIFKIFFRGGGSYYNLGGTFGINSILLKTARSEMIFSGLCCHVPPCFPRSAIPVFM